MNQVSVKIESRSIPTYGVGDADKNPLFFEKRVYQGSCGKVYPVPFIDKVFDVPEPRDYQVVRMENSYLRIEILPEIGGRVFLGQDKCNGDYDFIYRQDVIKPALVGLAGPWISGGIEFNWPQHHRPGTFMPCDVFVEHELDGSVTVWLSEHDPMSRMKGMHGLRLRPDSALIELRVRLFNRTAEMQTFLWWANMAARVHEDYQSFFPDDVHYVADHAVRAMSDFPIARGSYYGIDYGNRKWADDLRWYRNIPVPTSYMVCETEFDFMGGYDHRAEGGVIHVADRHVVPGKKQWTWGNDEFGWAWDRELTDESGPYIELMAGAYTDNQPDFTYLSPYETKTFSQYWWPYSKIGPVHNATDKIAVRMELRDDRTLALGVVAPVELRDLRLTLYEGDVQLFEVELDVAPSCSWQRDEIRFTGENPDALHLAVSDRSGNELIVYRPSAPDRHIRHRQVAVEPDLPESVASNEELFLIGEHLDQYRHSTRYSESYWSEALKRDPKDARCNLAMGKLTFHRGQFDQGERFLRVAVARMTQFHPNPHTGEAHYYLGLCLKFQNRLDQAYSMWAKASWDGAWTGAAEFAMACVDGIHGNFGQALHHLEKASGSNPENNKARILYAVFCRRMKQPERARIELESLLEMDPLDHWARFEYSILTTQGFEYALQLSRNDAQTMLDLAFDYADAGCYVEAIEVINQHHSGLQPSCAVPNPLARTPLTYYVLAWLYSRYGDLCRSKKLLQQAGDMSPDFCFPSRLQEQVVLDWVLEHQGDERNAAYALGNFCYDRKRHMDAVACWKRAQRADPNHATTHRNLAIAAWNQSRDRKAARIGYLRAIECDPNDARLVAEFAQLRRRLGDAPSSRLAFLEERSELVDQRDDVTIERIQLENELGKSAEALERLLSRRFHPWEGGEGKVLNAYKDARIRLGKEALETGAVWEALNQFEAALEPPHNLGEKYHLLQAKADIHYWIGRALQALGREIESVSHFEISAGESGGGQNMEVRTHTEMSYFRGLSLLELGRVNEALALFDDMRFYAEGLFKESACIEYFATSLPNLLVLEDDLDESQRIHAESLLRLSARGLDAVSRSSIMNSVSTLNPT